MIWIAIVLLGLLGATLVAGWSRRGRSDAAGNALEHAWLVLGTLVLALLATPVVIGWWLDSTVLMAAPLLLLVVPVVFRAQGAMRRRLMRVLALRRSRLPTPELRELEWQIAHGNTTVHIATIGRMLAGGLDVTDPAIGRPLVSTAIRSAGANEKLKLLLQAGADPTEPQALEDAVWHSDCLFTLFAHGVSPRALLPSGDPVLFKALDQHSFLLIEKLVEAGADTNQPDRDGWPLLVAHVTKRRGYGVVWPSIAWLVEHGADPFQKGPDGTCLADVVRATDPAQIDPESLDRLRARLAR